MEEVIVTRSATVDVTVKWHFNPRRQIEFEHGGYLCSFQKPQ
jgi:hypothetical protein